MKMGDGRFRPAYYVQFASDCEDQMIVRHGRGYCGQRYNNFFGLNLSSAEKQDLVQFLLSI